MVSSISEKWANGILICGQVLVGERHVRTSDAGSRAAETAYFEDGFPMTTTELLILSYLV